MIPHSITMPMVSSRKPRASGDDPADAYDPTYDPK